MAKEFEGEFNCLGENTEKYETFLIPITKGVKRIDKIGEEIVKTISYKLLFLDSARFMASSLSSLVGNLAEGIHKIKCKYEHDNKKCQKCGTECKDCECCLEYTNVKDDLIECKCLCCNKNHPPKKTSSNNFFSNSY